MSDFEWTDAKIASLRTLWAEGKSSKAIGDLLGCSKNAVVGKADRLGLPERPMPVSISAARELVRVVPKPAVVLVPRAQPLPLGARTLPPLPSEQ